MTLIFSFTLLVVLLSACYHRASWSTCVTLTGLTVLIGTIVGAFGALTWLLMLAATVPLSITNIRKQSKQRGKSTF